jgi:PAS domain S-box-containing protein
MPDLTDALYRAALSSLPDTVILIFDQDLRLQAVEGAGRAAQAYSQQAAPGQLLTAALPAPCAAVIVPLCQAALAGQSCSGTLLDHQTLYDLHAQPLYSETGALLGGLVISRPANPAHSDQIITARYHALLTHTSDVFLLCDQEYYLLDWNQRALDLFGYDHAHFARLRLIDLLAPEQREACQYYWQRLLAGETLPLISQQFVRADGHPIDAETDLSLVQEVRGQSLYVQAVVRDVTTYQKAKAELRESEERYRMLVSNFPDSVVLVYDRDLRFILADGPEIERTGFSKKRLEGRTLYEALDPAFASQVEPLMRQTLAGVSFSATVPYGPLHYLYSYVPLRSSSGDVIYGMIIGQNITDRVTSEKALRTSEERFRLLTLAISDGVYDWNIEDNTSWYSEGYWKNFADEQAATGVEDWVRRIHPDERERVLNSQMQAIDQGQQSWTSEYRLLSSGGHYVTVLDRAYIMRDATGKARRVIGAVSDVTALRAAERQALELRLQKEKSQVLTGYITAISHDFRTPLAIINTSAYLWAKKQDSSPKEGYDQQIIHQVSRIEQLVEGLLTLARLDREEQIAFAPLDANELLSYLELSKRPACAEKQLHLSVEQASDLPRISGHPQWLHLALSNLIDNAITYTPAGGSIWLRTATEAGRVLIEIQDTGIGIAPDHLQHILTPLYRAEAHRPATSGTGLGLPITARIVEVHHGTLTLASTPGNGTTVRITLPPAAAPLSVP